MEAGVNIVGQINIQHLCQNIDDFAQLLSIFSTKKKLNLMQVRGTFSPIFTSGKMKGMLGFIKITADHLVKEFDKFGEGTEEVDCKVGLIR